MVARRATGIRTRKVVYGEHYAWLVTGSRSSAMATQIYSGEHRTEHLMPAYVVFIRDRTRDQEGMTAYSKLSGSSLAGHSAKLLAAHGEHETLEGATAEAVVLLEFSSVAAAKAWYDSPAYTEARKLRNLASDCRVVVFEGR